MKHFAKATPAPKLAKPNDRYVGMACAGLLTIMLVSQLFTFEKLVPILEGLDMGGGEPTAKILASVIVICELFALPFLLRMRLSPLMRITSLTLGWLAVLMWLYMAILSIALPGLRTIGLFGAVIPIPGGLASVACVMILSAMMLWATAVLWPSPRVKHAAKK